MQDQEIVHAENIGQPGVPAPSKKWRVEAVPVDFHYHVMIKAGREPDEYPKYRWYCETEEQAKELADKLVDVDVGVSQCIAVEKCP